MGRQQKILGQGPEEFNPAQDLRIAAAHLQCALAALGCAKASVTAAYAEQALHHCQLEIAEAAERG